MRHFIVKRSRSGAESLPCRVVAPIRQNFERFTRTDRAATPESTMMSITKSSIAE